MFDLVFNIPVIRLSQFSVEEIDIFINFRAILSRNNPDNVANELTKLLILPSFEEKVCRKHILPNFMLILHQSPLHDRIVLREVGHEIQGGHHGRDVLASSSRLAVWQPDFDGVAGCNSAADSDEDALDEVVDVLVKGGNPNAHGHHEEAVACDRCHDNARVQVVQLVVYAESPTESLVELRHHGLVFVGSCQFWGLDVFGSCFSKAEVDALDFTERDRIDLGFHIDVLLEYVRLSGTGSTACEHEGAQDGKFHI